MICKNVKINGRRTSLRMEPEIWEALYEVAQMRDISPAALVTEIENNRGEASTTAALRLYCLRYYRSALREAVEAEGKSPSLAPPRATKRKPACDGLPA